MAALGSEHEWIIPFILKCIVHQQTVKLQNSFQIAERMAYLLRSGLWHREVHDLLSRKTLGDHGIEKEKLSPPSNQFPGTPWSCMLPEITTHLDLNIRVSFKNQTGSYVSDISEHTSFIFLSHEKEDKLQLWTHMLFLRYCCTLHQWDLRRELSTWGPWNNMINTQCSWLNIWFCGTLQICANTYPQHNHVGLHFTQQTWWIWKHGCKFH